MLRNLLSAVQQMMKCSATSVFEIAQALAEEVNCMTDVGVHSVRPPAAHVFQVQVAGEQVAQVLHANTAVWHARCHGQWIRVCRPYKHAPVHRRLFSAPEALLPDSVRLSCRRHCRRPGQGWISERRCRCCLLRCWHPHCLLDVRFSHGSGTITI